jgi:hypothetical protein
VELADRGVPFISFNKTDSVSVKAFLQIQKGIEDFLESGQ